jgi:hypothetical protein
VAPSSRPCWACQPSRSAARKGRRKARSNAAKPQIRRSLRPVSCAADFIFGPTHFRRNRPARPSLHHGAENSSQVGGKRRSVPYRQQNPSPHQSPVHEQRLMEANVRPRRVPLRLFVERGTQTSARNLAEEQSCRRRPATRAARLRKPAAACPPKSPQSPADRRTRSKGPSGRSERRA